MVLVDTSVWIDYLQGKRSDLQTLLQQNLVLCHPFVIGELALGSLRNRDILLKWLSRLPGATMARHAEVLQLISGDQLFGEGIGYVDAHLLASVRLTSGASLLTSDKRLHSVAARSALAFSPS